MVGILADSEVVKSAVIAQEIAAEAPDASAAIVGVVTPADRGIGPYSRKSTELVSLK